MSEVPIGLARYTTAIVRQKKKHVVFRDEFARVKEPSRHYETVFAKKRYTSVVTLVPGLTRERRLDRRGKRCIFPVAGGVVWSFPPCNRRNVSHPRHRLPGIVVFCVCGAVSFLRLGNVDFFFLSSAHP